MGRRASTAGGRPVVVASRFSQAEADDMDARRGALTRAEWLRWLQARARREDIRLPDLPE